VYAPGASIDRLTTSIPAIVQIVIAVVISFSISRYLLGHPAPVTAVTVTPESTNPNGKKYQGEFADGIAAEVVGKSLNELKVSKVAGSSLTSGGFNDAVDKIKADAGV
jgi:hypothetical protein